MEQRAALRRSGAALSEGPPEPPHPAPTAAIPKAMPSALSPPFPSSDVKFRLHLCGARDRGHAWKWLRPQDLCRWEPQHLPAFCLKSPVVEEQAAAFSPGILNQRLDLVGGVKSSGTSLRKSNVVLRSIWKEMRSKSIISK